MLSAEMLIVVELVVVVVVAAAAAAVEIDFRLAVGVETLEPAEVSEWNLARKLLALWVVSSRLHKRSERDEEVG